MAVTADFLLEEDQQDEGVDNDYRSGSRNSAGQVERQERHEILETGAALSDEAFHLLKRASRSLVKRRRARRSIVAPLYRQLKSLRTSVPFSTPSRKSCVISDTLGYLKQLKKEIRDLHGGKKTSESVKRLRDLPDSTVVEVISVEAGLQIHVSCNKRPGLMAQLMEALEGLGLIFQDVNASCQDSLIFDASSTQVGVHSIDKHAVERVIERTICQPPTTA